VRQETCAEVAREVGLGEVLKLGRSEMLSGGRRKDALLGDAMEAVIAAVYLDAGFEAARALVLRLWGPDRAGGRRCARREDRLAGMGAGARPAAPGLYRNRPHRPRPCSRSSPSRRGWKTARTEPARRDQTRRRTGRRRALLARMEANRMTEDTRAGFVALIGEPNAGKSTLLNRMVGAKVSIVTHKVQTTRTRIRGVCMEGAAQIVFVDTPGLFRPRRRLDRAMVAAAWGGAAGCRHHRAADRGASRPDRRRAGHHRPHARHPAPPARGAGHQQDRPGQGRNPAGADRQPERGLSLRQNLHDLGRTGYGVDDCANGWRAELPEGPWFYPEDQIADLPMRMIAAEITREKLTLRLHEELPYQLTVETEKWEDRPDGSARIDQIVYVARDGHKGIVLGNQGRDDQGHRPGRAGRNRRIPGPRPSAPVPDRQGPPRLAGRGRALFGNGAGFQGRRLTAEPLKSRAGLMADRRALAALNAACALLRVALPEREPHSGLYAATLSLLDALEQPADWSMVYLRWELRLLEDLGFGLDLSACAVTGRTEGLAYVSPRTGRAVSHAGAGDWADRLLPLPPSLAGAVEPAPGDVGQGLAITGHFLARELAPVLAGRPLPEARARLVQLIDRAP
jgi:GTPase